MPAVELRLGQSSSLSFTPLDGNSIQFSRQISVEKLTLISEERYLSNVPDVRRVSSVLAGTLYLKALNAKSVPLPPSETQLGFRTLAGTLRSVSMAAPGLRLQISATVSGMTVGESPNAHSLMPSYLQRIATSDELWLWWGSAASGFAILMSILRWLKITS